MKAMLLAAGPGTRMRPLTEATAKPLLPLGGRSLLDHALDRLRDAGVTEVVVNAYWHADHIAAHLAGRSGGPRTIVRREELLLGTGGGVAAVLDLLGPDPFFVINGDTFWLDGPTPAIKRLAASWDNDVDAVLLVHRTYQVPAEIGAGDFALDPWGVVRRRGEREIVPYIYAGIQLASPALFADAPAGSFSMNLLWDRAIARRRLRGVVHDGLWFHLSTPTDLAAAEYSLHSRGAGEWH
jgi:MurNAc alpha-1-phosphate uridylyltransferase